LFSLPANKERMQRVSTDTTRARQAKSSLIERIIRVELRVTDVDRALSFYRDVAGFDVEKREGERASLRAAEAPAFLVLDAAGVTEPADPRATGLFHTAFRYPDRSSLGDALARVAHSGLELGASDHLVSEALYVDDPDGNGVELYWDRPAAEWPAPTDDMLVPMASLPLDLDGLYRGGRGSAAVGDRAPEGADVGHVHLQVSDVGETVRFYTNVLGLDLTARMGSSAGFLSSNGYHHHVGANTWRSRRGKPAPRERAGLERVVFAVSGEDELEALRARLRTEGWQVEDRGRGVSFLDPDKIELTFVVEDD
jgi:catechol 2,3-dioxygenase